MSAAGFVIEVERCADCPFIKRLRMSMRSTHKWWGCGHPNAEGSDPKESARMGEAAYTGLGRNEPPEKPPPDWCPLRGSVTAIRGPK